MNRTGIRSQVLDEIQNLAQKHMHGAAEIHDIIFEKR